MAIELGTVVTDKITGYKGIATSRCEFMSGCVRIGVQATELKDGKRPDVDFFDELDLKENDPSTTKPINALLGTVVTDSITGFKGTVLSRSEYRHASPRVLLQPAGLTKEGKPIESVDFDETQLKEYKAPKTGKQKGGPGDMAKAPRMATRF